MSTLPPEDRYRSSAHETLNRFGDIDRKIIAIETRMEERWNHLRDRFRAIDERLSAIETALKSAGQTSSSLQFIVKDPKVIIIAAIALGTALGNAGVNPIDWFIK